jgi:hypothetical protein
MKKKYENTGYTPQPLFPKNRGPCIMPLNTR